MVSLLIPVLLQFFSFSIVWGNGTNHDFENIKKGEPVFYDFEFLNQSTEPVTVEIVRTSCGCADTVWPKEPIPVDSIGTIRVNYDASDKGYFTKKIKVFFEDVRLPERLTIEGKIVE